MNNFEVKYRLEDLEVSAIKINIIADTEEWRVEIFDHFRKTKKICLMTEKALAASIALGILNSGTFDEEAVDIYLYQTADKEQPENIDFRLIP